MVYLFKVDDGEYFQTLPENTIFLFLRPGELWRPAGTDSIRSGKKLLKKHSCRQKK